MATTDRTMRGRWSISAVVVATATALIAPFLVTATLRPLLDRHSQPSLPTAADPASSQVTVVESGKLFHDPRCGFIHGRPEAVSLAVAEARGYSPCPRCLGALRGR